LKWAENEETFKVPAPGEPAKENLRDTEAPGRNLTRHGRTALASRLIKKRKSPMKHVLYLLALLILPLLLGACTGAENDASRSAQEPQLIMFYTDN
jgi:hypothetical protein